MKSTVIIVFSCSISVFATGQNSFLNFFPNEIKAVDLTVKRKKEIERRDLLLYNENKTSKEQQELETLCDKYGEPESFWHILKTACDWYCGDANYTIKASSALKNSDGLKYEASSANDLSYETAWVEGKKDEGIGEWIEYYFKNNGRGLTTIIVSNGYMKSEATWKNNNRVKKLKLSVNGKTYGILNLKDSRTDQVFKLGTLGREKEGTDLILRFEILEVYRGVKYNDTAITEIYFDGPHH